MAKLSPLLFAATFIFTASTSVFGMPLRASSAPDISFSVFFDPGAASLPKEGQEIISVVAKRFAATHDGHSAARIIVSSETDDQASVSLSNERVKAVSTQLVRDGIPGKFVSVGAQPTVHADAVRLLQSLDRRVSIGIQENSVIGGL
jgi:outer membrane protein OmpA-like peptidoglycan-associated protein